MDDKIKEFIELIKGESCDYNRCRELIVEIGGSTTTIKASYNYITTPIHELIGYAHLDFALELIREPGFDPNVCTEDEPPIIWSLQYLESEDDEKQWEESERKLRIMRTLISLGADPNPVVDEEELLYYIRYKIAEASETYPNHFHLLYMEHIIDAITNGKTECFYKILEQQLIKYVMVAKSGFRLVDDNCCDTEYLIFIFENGERYALSGYQIGDDEWDFYAAPVRKEITLSEKHYKLIYPTENYIRFNAYEKTKWGTVRFRFEIDDASLLVYNDDNGVTVVVTDIDPEVADETRKRKELFID